MYFVIVSLFSEWQLAENSDKDSSEQGINSGFLVQLEKCE